MINEQFKELKEKVEENHNIVMVILIGLFALVAGGFIITAIWIDQIYALLH